MSKKKKERFDVFFQQVNRQVITVLASNDREAAEIASRKWRKESAWPTVDAVQTADKP